VSKILHVVNIYFVLPYFIGDQFKYFKNLGYNQHVICSPSNNLNAYSKKMGFEYAEIQIARAIKPITDIYAIILICKYIKKNVTTQQEYSLVINGLHFC
jgi:hypothetical protein